MQGQRNSRIMCASLATIDLAGWGCFAVTVVRDLVNSLCPLSHSSELLYAADTGNDYNYRLEEMEVCPGLSVQFYFLCY